MVYCKTRDQRLIKDMAQLSMMFTLSNLRMVR